MLTLSSILLLLSLFSFLPQCRLILSRGTSSGISLYYVLFNLIVATEQFAIGLHLHVDNVEIDDAIIQSPPSVGDWLNLAQFASVWLGHLAL